MTEAPALERLWFGRGIGPRAARLALAPLELAYGGITAARNSLYDRGVLRSFEPRIPALSVGNLTVGGTGKTPVAAWMISRLADLGAHPAVVMRGYGDDEPLVHEQLNRGIPVVVMPDRLAGIERAVALGADCVVLDDAFQHRRARRVADVVLVSADRWSRHRHLLPAGPWRERPGALRRASVVLVTRKAASPGEARTVGAALRRAAPDVPQALAQLALGDLNPLFGGDRLPLRILAGARVSAIAAVGDPEAFVRQLAHAGAVVRFNLYPDHHRYSAADAARLASSLEGGELGICTLKDAVKLADLWPREGPPLWYVSQRVAVEEGGEAIESLLRSVLDARHPQP